MSEDRWMKAAVGDLFSINTKSCFPRNSPDCDFFHHSLPAWDLCRGPIVEKGASIESNKTVLNSPCVLVSKLNPRKPRVSVVERVPDTEAHCASTEFVCLEPRVSIPLGYWGHYFGHEAFAQSLDNIAIGSTNSHKRFYPKELLRRVVLTPKAAEQSAIARILDTLDTQIEKTQALIAKLEQVKEGLLHDLLTRGVDENGELRPSAEEAPELYKESALGLIPREWEAITLQSCSSVTVGFVGTTSNFYTSSENGVMFFRTGNITDSGLCSNDIKWVTKAFHAANRKSALAKGDVVVSRVGYTGNAAVVDFDAEANCANMIIIRPNNSIASEFLSLLFSSQIVERQVTGFTIGSAQPVLNINLVKKILVVTPSTTEQNLIVERLTNVESEKSDNLRVLEGLKLLKSGLMDDLLTGHVRTTPLLDREPAEAT